MKESSHKLTYPGCKQIFRTTVNGQMRCDRLGLKDEQVQDNEEGLLQLVMEGGKRCQDDASLEQIGQRVAMSVASLPNNVRQINNPDPLNVNISPALSALRQSIAKQTSVATH